MSGTKKTVLIVGLSLLGAGLILLGVSLAAGFTGGGNRGDNRLVQKELTLNAGDSLYVSTAAEDVSITVSPDENAHFSYYEGEDVTYSLAQADGEVSLVRNEAPAKFFWFQVGNWQDNITIELPSDFSGDIKFFGSTGSLQIEDFESLAELKVSVSTGDVYLNNLSAQSLNVGGSTSGIYIDGFNCAGSAKILSTTGWIYIEGMKIADTLACANTTGGIYADGVKAKSIGFNTTAGSMDFYNLSGDALEFNATTGSITGEINGSSADYSIKSVTTSGSSNLPGSWGAGGRSLQAKATAGSIDISFTED